ncbi:MAG: hypothetical protein J7K62_03170 [Thermoplasmata archaeon]|nr:hypothetical protein [Thermoplasmata archaeon]
MPTTGICSRQLSIPDRETNIIPIVFIIMNPNRKPANITTRKYNNCLSEFFILFENNLIKTVEIIAPSIISSLPKPPGILMGPILIIGKTIILPTMQKSMFKCGEIKAHRDLEIKKPVNASNKQYIKIATIIIHFILDHLFLSVTRNITEINVNNTAEIILPNNPGNGK